MTDEQTAAQLVSFGQCSTDAEFEAAIVRALQAARTPPPGHIIDDAGVVRKVLGTLPITKDGVVAGRYAHVWRIDSNGRLQDRRLIHENVLGYFSTREAAEAAKEANK